MDNNEEYLIDCLRILRTNKIGPVTYNLLKQKYKNFKTIIENLEKSNIVVETRENAIKEINNHKNIHSILLEKDMVNYPEKLKNYSKHFPLISVIGNYNIINKNTIGIVGARECSVIGLEFTKLLTKKIRENFITVSGMAKGVDSIVAENSIDGHIGVLPGGINYIYPSSSKEIYEILKNNPHSCLISCQSFNKEPQKHMFPIRNQLIAALSDGLIVVEAKSKSGSLQTAQWTLNYNKKLLVVPGHPMDPNYTGNNQLLKNQNAIAFYDNTDLEKIIYSNTDYLVNDEDYWNSVSETIDLHHKNIDNIQNEILKMISLTPVSINHLAHYLNYPVGLIVSGCMVLELKGLLIVNHDMTVNKLLDYNFFDYNI